MKHERLKSSLSAASCCCPDAPTLLMLRMSAREDVTIARIAAVFTFIGVIDVPFIMIAVLFLRPSTAGLRAAWWLLIGVGVFDTSANMLFGLATKHGLLSVVSVLASLYPVILVALARIFLHERIARHQLAGVAVALGGVALISAG